MRAPPHIIGGPAEIHLSPARRIILESDLFALTKKPRQQTNSVTALYWRYPSPDSNPRELANATPKWTSLS
ncbi:hypothetical protein MES5069_300007 [Mesorhizobium escarrei]|uniref:Uncharacterized protein n=1 Tax=Mesorhizobium escarrei TaxID=666018 RepID=A0ABM9DZL0_9HYPH|nr:hypothetical protein MES5069_300007 [Mesorhizobium escarrei]